MKDLFVFLQIYANMPAIWSLSSWGLILLLIAAEQNWNVNVFLKLGFYLDSFWPVKHLWTLTRKEGNWPLEFFLKWIHSFWWWKNSCKTLGCILIYHCECIRQAPVKWLICLTISDEFTSLKNYFLNQLCNFLLMSNNYF